MSSTNKTANYELSQFVGTDIPSILNDYNGDMRKIDTAIKAVANAEGSSASDIAGLQATVGQHTTEISGINSTVNSLSGRVIGIEGKIPASASESNKLITAQDIPEIPDITQLTQDVADLQEEVSDMGGDVKAIQLCVPATASESNKFATMADVGGYNVHTITAEAGETLGTISEKIETFIKSLPLNAQPHAIIEMGLVVYHPATAKYLEDNNQISQYTSSTVNGYASGIVANTWNIHGKEMWTIQISADNNTVAGSTTYKSASSTDVSDVHIYY